MADRLASFGEMTKKPFIAASKAVNHVPGVERSRKWRKRNVRLVRNQEQIEKKHLVTKPGEHLLLTDEQLGSIESSQKRPFTETQLVGVNALRNVTRRFDDEGWKTADRTDRNNQVGRQVETLFQAEERRVNVEGMFVDGGAKSKPQPIELAASQATMPDGSSVKGIKISQPDGSEYIAQQILGRKEGKFLCRVVGQKDPVAIPMGDVLRAQVTQEATALSSLISGDGKRFFDVYTGALGDFARDTNPTKSSPILTTAMGGDPKAYQAELAVEAQKRGMITRNDYELAVNKITGYFTDSPPPTSDHEGYAKWQHRQRLMSHLKADVQILDGATVRVILGEQFDRVRSHAQNEVNNAPDDTTRANRADRLRALDEILKDPEALSINFDAVQAGAIQMSMAREVRDSFLTADVKGGPDRLIRLARENLHLSNQADSENQLRGSRRRKTYKSLATILLLLLGASYILFNKGMGAGEDRGGYG